MAKKNFCLFGNVKGEVPSQVCARIIERVFSTAYSSVFYYLVKTRAFSKAYPHILQSYSNERKHCTYKEAWECNCQEDLLTCHTREAFNFLHFRSNQCINHFQQESCAPRSWFLCEFVFRENSPINVFEKIVVILHEIFFSVKLHAVDLRWEQRTVLDQRTMPALYFPYIHKWRKLLFLCRIGLANYQVKR